MIKKSGAITQDNEDKLPTPDMNVVKEWLDAKGLDGKQILDEDNRGMARNACLKIWRDEESDISTSNLSDEQI